MTYPTAVRNAEERSCVPCHARGEVENERMMWSLAESDTADWTMQTSSGQSCMRGLRLHAATNVGADKDRKKRQRALEVLNRLPPQ